LWNVWNERDYAFDIKDLLVDKHIFFRVKLGSPEKRATYDVYIRTMGKEEYKWESYNTIYLYDDDKTKLFFLKKTPEKITISTISEGLAPAILSYDLNKVNDNGKKFTEIITKIVNEVMNKKYNTSANIGKVKYLQGETDLANNEYGNTNSKSEIYRNYQYENVQFGSDNLLDQFESSETDQHDHYLNNEDNSNYESASYENNDIVSEDQYMDSDNESNDNYFKNQQIAEVIEREADKATSSGTPQSCEGHSCWVKSVLNKQLGINLIENNQLDQTAQNAIADFQIKNNLPSTKKINAATERALLEADSISRDAGTVREQATKTILSAAKSKIEDFTKQAQAVVDKPEITNGMRDPRKLFAFVLHHMAFKRRNRHTKLFSDPNSYLKTGAHFCIMLDGRIIQLHPLSRMIWHAQCLSPRSVSVEFEGNFPNIKGKWWINRKERVQNKDIPTQAQFDSGRFLASYLKTVLNTTHIMAHRQSSDSRENDPGPDIWYNIGQWGIDNLGLTDGGPDSKCGKGKPILPEWRTWGNKTSTLINKEHDGTEAEVKWEDSEDANSEVERESERNSFRQSNMGGFASYGDQESQYNDQSEFNETMEESEGVRYNEEEETRSYPQIFLRNANSYLTLTGVKQGKIKGGVIQKGREGTIAVYKLHHEITSPRDTASGAATGRRIHKPLVITKQIDMSSVKLLHALVTNEIIKEVVINFYQPDSIGAQGGRGIEVNHYRIKLTNAAISNISQDLPNVLNPDENKLPFLEKVEFVYQKIEWEYLANTPGLASDSMNGTS
ncbi:MAG: type VI secretion system tube protein TssD, partial [Bacteroidota bacterium]